MTDEEYKRRKEFASEIADNLSVEELAMIIWKEQCVFCSRRRANPICYGYYNCVSGILTKAQQDFRGKYDFYNGKEQTNGEQ